MCIIGPLELMFDGEPIKLRRKKSVSKIKKILHLQKYITVDSLKK